MSQTSTPRAPGAAASPSRRDTIPGLHGLRGIAALIVVLSHLSLEKMHLVPGTDFSGIGKSGVYLFFVLSAFLLTTQMLAWDAADFRRVDRWRTYVGRRVFRIWPLFLVVITVCVLTTVLGQPFFDGQGFPVTMEPRAFVKTLLLLQGDDILWTIPVEFKFYFLLPIIVFVLAVVLRKRLLPCLVALTLAIAVSLLLWPRVSAATSPLPFLNLFLFGVLGAVVNRELTKSSRGARKRLAFEILAWGCVAAFILTIPSVYRVLADPAAGPDRFHRSHLLFGILWTTLLLGMLHGVGAMRRFLDSRALVFLGMVSYSLYLWHAMVLKAAVSIPGDSPGLKGWIAVLAAVAFAAGSYYLIEAPAVRASDRWIRRSRAGRPEPEPASTSAGAMPVSALASAPGARPA